MSTRAEQTGGMGLVQTQSHQTMQCVRRLFFYSRRRRRRPCGAHARRRGSSGTLQGVGLETDIIMVIADSFFFCFPLWIPQTSVAPARPVNSRDRPWFWQLQRAECGAVQRRPKGEAGSAVQLSRLAQATTQPRVGRRRDYWLSNAPCLGLGPVPSSAQARRADFVSFYTSRGLTATRMACCIGVSSSQR